MIRSLRSGAALLLLCACAAPPDTSSPESLAEVHQAVSAGIASLTADLTPVFVDDGSAPGEWVDTGTTVYFTATTLQHGKELWVTDGTAAGTWLVDNGSGRYSSWPSALGAAAPGTLVFQGSYTSAPTVTRGTRRTTGPYTSQAVRVAGPPLSHRERVYFVARNVEMIDGRNISVIELWSGTAAAGSAQKVARLTTYPASIAVRALVPFGERVLFNVGDDAGDEPWVTDGTDAGTRRLGDLSPGSTSSSPAAFTVLGTRAIFTATAGGPGIWVTDGTPDGTSLLAYLEPGVVSLPNVSPVAWNGAFWWFANRAGRRVLVRSDGTMQGTRQVMQLPDATSALFAATDALVWFDATTLFRLLPDGSVRQHPLGVRPALDSPAVTGNLLFFRGFSDVAGWELCVADAADGQVRLVSDVQPGARDGVAPAGALFASRGRAFFAGDPGVGGLEPWVSDGTSAGTRALGNLSRGGRSSGNFGWMAAAGPRVVTSTYDLSRIVTSDGTASGTGFVGARGSAALFVTLAGRVFYEQNDAGWSIWSSDGTEAGTRHEKFGRLWSTFPGPYRTDAITFKGGALLNNWTDKVDYQATSGGPWVSLRRTGAIAFVTQLGDFAYFPGRLDSYRPCELLRSDGTVAGTRPVYQFGTTSRPCPVELVASGSRLFFVERSGAGPTLFVSDGTSEGTRPLSDVAPVVAPLSDPSFLFDHAGTLYFRAPHPEYGAELWRTDGTATGTRLAVDFVPGLASGTPEVVGVFQGRLVVLATDGTHGAELWMSDGTAGGTTMLRDIWPGARSSMPSSFLPLDDRGLFLFNADDGRNGRELWVSDGTTAGTRLLQQIGPGGEAGVTSKLVRAENRVFFAADDWLHGNELWSMAVADVRLPARPALACSDLTLEATSPAGAPRPALPVVATTSNGLDLDLTTTPLPATLPLGTHLVEVTGGDGAGGIAACSFRFIVRDSTPPALVCPSELVVEATSPAGTAVSPGAAATDLVSTPTVMFAPSVDALPLGRTSVRATARDAAGNEARCTFAVEVRDTTPPTLECPANLTREATSAAGAPVTFAAAVSDNGSVPSVTYDPASGTVFPLGRTDVGATATDGSGLAATCRFDVTVADTTAPALTCPPLVRVEATGLDGARATVEPAVAVDAVGVTGRSGDEPLTRVYPLGTTEVTQRAVDAAGNAAVCITAVVVEDTTPPSLRCPPAVRVEAAGPEGTLATVEPAVAADAVRVSEQSQDGPLTRVYPLGRTEVTQRAVDSAGNSSVCTTAVDVVDTIAPDLPCPPELRVEATGPQGAVVTVADTPARDAVGVVERTRNEPVTRRYPLGRSEVSQRAVDAAGNATVCTTAVVVEDTTAPALRCPRSSEIEADQPGGALVPFAPPEVADAVSTPDLVVTPPSGTLFPLGASVVEVRATDAAGNVAECSFEIRVTDTTAPALACPADRTVEATSAAGAPLQLEPAAATDAAGPVTVRSDQHGAPFPLGETVVTFVATDAQGQETTCRTRVVVVDSTPPLLVCPPDRVVEALGPDGAPAPFAAEAFDAVSEPQVRYSLAPGSQFSLGATSIDVTATDAAGNVSSCSFVVTVSDRRPPALACPMDPVVEATGPGGARADFSPAVSDEVSEVTVVAEPASGALFPLGETPVRVVARDAAGNESACAFAVNVVDTTPPALACPTDAVILDAEGPHGARHALEVEASDVASEVSLAASPTLEGDWPLGDTPVQVTAVDGAGLVSSCAFIVRVIDRRAPVVHCPGSVLVEATEPGGARVPFSAVAEDPETGVVPARSSPESGALFALGTTAVQVRAADASGNEGSCAFEVRVVDTTAPQLTCPAEATLPYDSDVSAVGSLVTATDTVTPAPELLVEGAPARVIARDGAGNEASCTVVVAFEPYALVGGCATPAPGALVLLSLIVLRRRRRARAEQ